MTEVQVREIRSEVTEDRIDIRNQLKEVFIIIIDFFVGPKYKVQNGKIIGNL